MDFPRLQITVCMAILVASFSHLIFKIGFNFSNCRFNLFYQLWWVLPYTPGQERSNRAKMKILIEDLV
jgi:hypothetical protein